MLGVFEAADKPATAAIGESVAGQARELVGQLAARAAGRGSQHSPDGKWEAFVRDHDLWLRDTGSKEEHRLTKGGGLEDTYSRQQFREQPLAASADAGPNSAPAAAPPARPEVWWSPDSKHLVALRTHTGPGHTVYMVESSPARPGPAEAASLRLPQARRPRSRSRKPHLFDVAAAKEIPVDDDLFPNPWSIDEVRWARRLLALHVPLQPARPPGRCGSSRSMPTTGEARPIIDEQSKTFIDYSGKLFVHYLDDTGEIIWMSRARRLEPPLPLRREDRRR